MADVVTILHAGEVNFACRGVGGALRLLHRVAERRDAEHAPARDYDVPAVERGARVEHLAVGVRRGRHAVETLDRVARARIGRIPVCGENDAQGGAPVPSINVPPRIRRSNWSAMRALRSGRL